MTKTPQNAPAPEFSRPFVLEGFEKPKFIRLEADAAECAALAARFGLDGLDRLTAEMTLTPKRAGRDLRVEGGFEAHVRQTCGVTLQPLEADLKGVINEFYSLDIEDEFSALEDEDASQLTSPDPMPEGEIDLGELTAEALGLEIDPFPRAPGAEFEAAEGENAPEATDDDRPNPFAALKKLKESGDLDPEKGR